MNCCLLPSATVRTVMLVIISFILSYDYQWK